MVMNASRSLVCHLIYRFDIGGLERVMANCINAMQENNIEHVVIALTEIGDFSKHLNPNVKTYQLNKKSGKDLASHWRLFKLLRKLKPDILHTYNLAALEYHPIAKCAGVKGHIHAEHGREISDPLGLNKKHNLLRKLISPFIHYFVPVSSDLQTWLIDVVNISGDKVKLIHNGIDIEKFSFKNQLHSECQFHGVLDRHSRGVIDRHSRGVLVGNPELKTIDSGLSDNRNDDVCDNRNDDVCDNRNDDVCDNRNDDGSACHSRGVLVGNPELKTIDSGLCDNRNDDVCDNRNDDGCDNGNDDGSECHSRGVLDRHSRSVLDRHSRGVLDGNPELKTVDSGLSDNRNDDGCDNRNDDGCDNQNDGGSKYHSRGVLDRHSRGVLDGNPELKTVDSGLCDNRNDDVCDNRNDDVCDNRNDDVCDNRNDDGCDNQNEDGSECQSQDVLDRHSRSVIDRHSRGVLDGNPELKAVDSGLSDNRNDDVCDNRNDDGSECHSRDDLDRHSQDVLDRHSRSVLVGNPELNVKDSGLNDNRNDDVCDNLNDDGCDNWNDERCIRFIHIARFNPVKDQQNLINAFALLVQENSHLPEQVCLTLVGDGDLTNELKQLVIDKKLNDFVIFTGARDDIPALLKSADIFVLSSIAEGIPMTILEAMAASLPIISTDVGGLSELVENGVSGLLVEKQNATALANAMHNYVKNPQLIKPQGEQAHQFIEKNFSEAAMINAYQNLYLQSLGQ